MNQSQAIVIGAGISGLACALRMRELGIATCLLEARDHAGGLISATRERGFLFESGPQSLQLTPDLRTLIRAAGCERALQEASPGLPRFILRAGKLRPAPMSPPSLLTTSLLSTGAKLRVLSEPFRRTRPTVSDESLASFVRRKFGTEILEYLAGPFVSGIFAGDPEKLSVRSAFPSLALWEAEYGSVIRGAIKSRRDGERVRPTLASFQGGVSTLLVSLASKLAPNITTGAPVSSIESGPNGWSVLCAGQSPNNAPAANAVVFATPAWAAAKILRVISPDLSASLAGVPYAPVAVVCQGYRREHVGHRLNGFGFLIPRGENLHTLGVIWNSSLFSDRCPQSMVLMTSFIGGASDPHIAGLENAEISTLVRREIAGILKITAPPVSERIWRHTPALPQYNLGHAQKSAAIRNHLSALRGIFITGNYLDGPSMGSCVSQAFQTAERVRDYLFAGAPSKPSEN